MFDLSYLNTSIDDVTATATNTDAPGRKTRTQGIAVSSAADRIKKGIKTIERAIAAGRRALRDLRKVEGPEAANLAGVLRSLIVAAQSALATTSSLATEPSDVEYLKELTAEVTSLDADAKAAKTQVATTSVPDIGGGEDPAPNVQIIGHEIQTDSPTLNDGFACEQDGSQDDDACSFFTPAQRHEAVDELRDRLTTALINFHSAIAAADIDIATEDDESTYWFAEILFGLVAGSVLSGVVALAVAGATKAAAKFAVTGAARLTRKGRAAIEGAKHAVEAHEEDIATVIERGGEPILDKFKEKGEAKATEAATEDTKHGKRAFLERCADMASIMKQRISEEAPARLKDVDLAGLRDAYSAEHHTVHSYAHKIEGLLKRYDANKIGEVGKLQDGVVGNHVLLAAKISAGGHTRTAIVQQAVYLETPNDGNGNLSNAERRGRPKFVRWVDTDFVGVAHARSDAESRASFKGYDHTEIWPDSWIYSPDDVDADGSKMFAIWRDEAESGRKALAPVDDGAADPADRVVDEDGGGE